MNPATWLTIITTLEPLAVPLIKDLVALFRAHPNLTPEQLAAVVSELAVSIHATNAETLALIMADQQAHPAA